MKGGKMTIDLTAEEKITIVQQHIKNIAYSKYNTQITLLEMDATATQNVELIASLNNQISDYNKQIAALEAEVNSLTPSSN
jgi:uncharacterized protein (UPF0276 family)